MIQKYKLKITISFYKSKKVIQSISRSIIWENKQDALDCKSLMEKGKISNNLSIEFIAFTEEESL